MKTFLKKTIIKRFLLNALFLISFSSSSFATFQEPDLLIYNGKTYYLLYSYYSNPLERYWISDKIKPPFKTSPKGESSSNARGFVATWQIIDNKLYLTKIDSWFCEASKWSKSKSGCHKVILQELFRNNVSNGKIFASWFSDAIVVTDGERLEYASQPDIPVFQREIIFNVNAGKAGKPSIIYNSPRYAFPLGEPPPLVRPK